jgi:hypothetical protein
MKAQAFGWLAAGVLAAGLNASYHNGGFEWAHRIADKVSYNTNAVLALATGNADRLYSQARTARVREANSSCPLSLAMARVENAIPLSNVAFAQFDRMSDRQKAQLDRLSARGARMEARLVRVNLPEFAVTPVVVNVPDVHVCPRVRVNVPRIPELKAPVVPQVHIEMPSADPI